MFFLGLLIAATPILVHAESILNLFDALEKQPITKIQRLSVRFSKASSNGITSSFYPVLEGFVSYTHFNSPTSLRPLLPTESQELIKSNAALPFSKNISQIGVRFSYAVFMKSLFDLKNMAEGLLKASKTKSKLDFISNEAALVVLNARFNYLLSLKRATKKRMASIKEQLRVVRIAVANGRMAGVDLIKIQSYLERLKVKILAIDSAISQVKSQIEQLTSVMLKKPASMKLIRMPQRNGQLKSLLPLSERVAAMRYKFKSKKDALLPSLYLTGEIARKFGKSYNTSEDVVKNYGNIALVVKIPIFNKKLYSSVEKAHVEYLNSEFELMQKKIELKATVKSLFKTLKLIKSSINTQKQLIEGDKKLVHYARIATASGRMTLQDYLRYEADLLEAYSDLFDLKLKRWEVIGKLAVIYGIDLRELVR